MMKSKGIFEQAAQNNFLTRSFIKNSERIASVGCLIGDTTLAVKQGVDVNLETLSGALFLCGAASLFFAGKNPIFMKTAGALGICGGVALGAAGIGEPGASPQIIGALPIILTGYLMTRNSIETIVDKAKELKRRGTLSRTFNRIRSSVRKMPLLSAAFLDISGKPFLMLAAIQQNDIGLGAAAIAWAVADLALGASDKSIKALVDKPKGP